MIRSSIGDKTVGRRRGREELSGAGSLRGCDGESRRRRLGEGDDFLDVVQAKELTRGGDVGSDVERRRRAVEWWWWRGLASPVAIGKGRESMEQRGSSISS